MMNFARIIIACSLLMGCLSACSFCSFDRTSINIGYYGDASSGTPLFSLDSDSSSGDFILGTSIIVKGEKALAGYSSAVLRYLEYDDGVKGLFFEPLENCSFGNGLIVDGLNTIYDHPIYGINDDNVLRTYIYTGYYTVDLFNTSNDLTGIAVSGLGLMGADIGFEYVGMTDGFPGYSADHTPDSSSYGVSLSYPFLLEGMNLYSEYARTSNDSSGSSLGISFDYELFFMFAHFKIEGRSLDPGFVPGYFTVGYDIDPINLTSYEASGVRRDGTYVGMEAGVLGIVGFGLGYENYTDSPNCVTLDFTLTPLDGLDVSGFFKQPTFSSYRDVSGSEAAIKGGTLAYTIDGITFKLAYQKAPLAGGPKAYEATMASMQYSF